jgi:hypothetical protein
MISKQALEFRANHMRQNRPTRFNVIFAALTLALLGGCTAVSLIQSTKIAKPDVKYSGYKLASANAKHAVVNISLTANNPNPIGLKNIFVSYELSTHGKSFLKGSDIELAFAPNGETAITIPADIIYANIFKAAGPVAARLLLGAKEIPITANVVVYGKPTVYSEVEQGALFSFSVNVKATFPVPISKESKEAAAEGA